MGGRDKCPSGFCVHKSYAYGVGVDTSASKNDKHPQKV